MAIAIYGATGFTGRLVAQQLARRGADLVLAGRDRTRLELVARECAIEAPARVAALDDPGALAALFDGCRVVVNCAAPTSVVGEALVRAAIAAGAHYTDTAGEQPFIRAVFEQYDEPARCAGVALVPGAGFDYALGDCIARLTACRVEPAAEVVIAYALEGTGVAGGAARGALESAHDGEVVYRDGSWRAAPLGVQRAAVTFPAPVGRRAATRYGAGEILTVPRHTRVRNVTALVTTSTLAPHPALLPVFPYLRPAAALVLRSRLRPLLRRALALLPARGPADEDRASARFVIAAIARGEDGAVARGAVRGADFYLLTAVALAHAAERLHAERFHGTGALGPAAAYDPAEFLDTLAEHGVRWERHEPA